jgi:FAD/FMN-containing dehydrogenase
MTPIVIRHLSGAIGRVPEDATAYANRSAAFNISIDSSWEDPADSARNIEWTRAAWKELHDLTGGGIYLNFAGFGEEPDALARSGYQANYERLRQVKRFYDPTNLFRGNINIKP